MIKMLQVLCPDRHAISALVFNTASCSEAQAREQVQEFFDTEKRHGRLRAHCGICGAPERKWLWEVRVMEEQDFLEAVKSVKAAEQLQLRTRGLLDRLGLSYDSLARRRRRQAMNN